MTTMRTATAPKSDQLNYDDMIGGQTKIIKITAVTIKPGKEQPISVFYEGDNGKPFKPCTIMARVLMHCWGEDANNYAGRSLMLYGDSTVIYGGAKVGGVRISHLSDIPGPITMALTTTRGNRKPYTVHPLKVAEETPAPSFDDILSDIKNASTLDDLGFKFKEAQRLFKDEAQRSQLVAAKDARKTELTATQGAA